MRALEFIMGHVIYNLAYTYKFQLKTTYDCLKLKILIRVNHDQLKGGLQYKGRWLCSWTSTVTEVSKNNSLLLLKISDTSLVDFRFLIQ